MDTTRVASVLMACGTAFALSALPAHAGGLADFYQGKTVKIVVGYGPGSEYTAQTQLVGRHIGDHIPGHPTVIVQNMPGAGTRKAASWLYNVAPKDGTAMGCFNQNIPMDQVLDKTKLKFDVRKFNWIGTPTHVNNVLFLWYKTGIKTVAEASKEPLVIGAGAGGNTPATIYPRIVNNFFGTKFRVISGYPSQEALLALERGEVSGLGSRSWAGLEREKPEWIRDHKLNVLFQIGTEKDPDLPNAPLLSDLAKTDEQREVLEFISRSVAVGRPIVAPPSVPAEKVAALRAAFDAAVTDPKFLADAEKQKLAVAPTSGKELQALVDKIVAVSPHAVAMLKEALKAKVSKRKGGKKKKKKKHAS